MFANTLYNWWHSTSLPLTVAQFVFGIVSCCCPPYIQWHLVHGSFEKGQKWGSGGSGCELSKSVSSSYLKRHTPISLFDKPLLLMYMSPPPVNGQILSFFISLKKTCGSWIWMLLCFTYGTFRSSSNNTPVRSVSYKVDPQKWSSKTVCVFTAMPSGIDVIEWESMRELLGISTFLHSWNRPAGFLQLSLMDWSSS